jgi:multiple sugar transport system substrate-binding protein
VANGHARLRRGAIESLCEQPDLDERPKITPFRDAFEVTRYNGYAGTLGYASAVVMGDFVMVDMVAVAPRG